MKETRILIAEDEAKIASLLRDYLTQHGYQADCLSRGDMVVGFVREKNPDLVLLDIMLPGMDGIEICKKLRSFTQVPVMMITARVEEADRVLGFELGADDYICKPFSPRELVARVKAVLRRARKTEQEDTIILGPFFIHESKRQVLVSGVEIKLTPNEFGLFTIMARHPGRVFTREELLNQVLGYRYDGYDRVIDSHIKNLRKKLSAYVPDKDMIISVYGVGYKLISM